jgi:3-hydroxyacyl-CoA dehydrogenase/enoyl-CoA hydratase/3-hydroxybutyryl-CoA epimerase
MPNPEVQSATTTRQSTQTEVQDRLVLLFVNEAIRCLDEGVIQSPTDGDLGAVLGLGFPPFRGGPFRYADSIGPAKLVAKLRSLEDHYGARYTPAGSLTNQKRKYYEVQQ